MLSDKDGKTNVPDFRSVALEEQFCIHLSELCRIFKDFGDLNGEAYDIYQMQKTLKIENWKQIVPFEYYLTPLQLSVKKVRDELLRMEKAGPLFSRYIIE